MNESLLSENLQSIKTETNKIRMATNNTGATLEALADDIADNWPSGNINITENGDVNVKGYETAHIEVETQGNYQDKSLTITQNGTTIVMPDEYHDALSTVVVTTNVGGSSETPVAITSNSLEELYLTPGKNGDIASVKKITSTPLQPQVPFNSMTFPETFTFSRHIDDWYNFDFEGEDMEEGWANGMIMIEEMGIDVSVNGDNINFYCYYYSEDGINYERSSMHASQGATIDGDTVTFNQYFSFWSEPDPIVMEFLSGRKEEFIGIFEYNDGVEAYNKTYMRDLYDNHFEIPTVLKDKIADSWYGFEGGPYTLEEWIKGNQSSDRVFIIDKNASIVYQLELMWGGIYLDENNHIIYANRTGDEEMHLFTYIEDEEYAIYTSVTSFNYGNNYIIYKGNGSKVYNLAGSVIPGMKGGIYDTTHWNWYNVHTNVTPHEILKGKVSYGNEGLITGNFYEKPTFEDFEYLRKCCREADCSKFTMLRFFNEHDLTEEEVIGLLSLIPDKSHITLLQNLFYGCSSLKHFDFNYLAGAKTDYLTSMFQNCTSLESIDNIDAIDCSGAIRISDCFNNTKLENIDLSVLDLSNVTDGARAFANTPNLSYLEISTLSLSNIISGESYTYAGMFRDCGTQSTGGYAPGIPWVFVRNESDRDLLLAQGSDFRPSSWSTNNVVCYHG